MTEPGWVELDTDDPDVGAYLAALASLDTPTRDALADALEVERAAPRDQRQRGAGGGSNQGE